jgi:hypothetical protein
MRARDWNPIAPYTWVASYWGGNRLHQYALDGYHYTTEIERERLRCLEIRRKGHPTLRLWPRPEQAPDEVCLFATVMIERAQFPGLRLQSYETARRILGYTFVLRYGTEHEGYRLGPAHQRVSPYAEVLS